MWKSLAQNHPKGLYLLFFVEMWERFSYYGMRALLVLYMVQHLMYSVQKAGNVYGVYTGLVYLTPLLGGYLADRYLGQRKCVSIGAILMAIGLFGLATLKDFLFLPALFMMILANGFFKSNISTILGMLYGEDLQKRDSGFTIFYMGINLGALFSPLVCGTLAVKFGFAYGFAAAGIGILIGYVIYKIFENKYLSNYGLHPYGENEFGEKITVEKALTLREKRRIYALFLLMAFSIFFWVCFEQAGCSITLFAEYSVDRFIPLLNKTIPTGYFQSLNPLFIIIFAPVMSVLWTQLAQYKKEPTSVSKFFIALLLISCSFFMLFFAAKGAESGLVSPFWLVGAFLIMTLAELCLSPIGLSLVSKLAPLKFASLLMGTWFLSSAIGNTIAGVFAGKYDSMSHSLFFLSLALCALFAALVLGLTIPTLKMWMGKK